jgi:hypothetical protein
VFAFNSNGEFERFRFLGFHAKAGRVIQAIFIKQAMSRLRVKLTPSSLRLILYQRGGAGHSISKRKFQGVIITQTVDNRNAACPSPRTSGVSTSSPLSRILSLLISLTEKE